VKVEKPTNVGWNSPEIGNLKAAKALSGTGLPLYNGFASTIFVHDVNQSENESE